MIELVFYGRQGGYYDSLMSNQVKHPFWLEDMIVPATPFIAGDVVLILSRTI